MYNALVKKGNEKSRDKPLLKKFTKNFQKKSDQNTKEEPDE